MLHLWIHLALMLFAILIASQLFTNALEHFGHKIKISAGVTGSIFAAIATALPETTVAVLAVIAGTPNKLINQQISVGAIVGSSLMLSTLATFLLIFPVMLKRGIYATIKPEKIGFNRDLNFFMIAFVFAAIAMFVPYHPIYFRAGISIGLLGLYFLYLVLTAKVSKTLVKKGHAVIPDEVLLLTKFKFKDNSMTIAIQLVVGLVLLLIGAKGFIDTVEQISLALNVSALLLSLIIIPFATELPEKANSLLWAHKQKDTLAFGNITGAMVFQGTWLPALGILLTPWRPEKTVLTGILITLFATAWLRLNVSDKGIRASSLFINGILYLVYLFLVLA